MGHSVPDRQIGNLHFFPMQVPRPGANHCPVRIPKSANGSYFETSRSGLLNSRKSGLGNILILARSEYPLEWIAALTNVSHFWLWPGQHTNVTRTTIRNWLILLVQLAYPLAQSGHSWPGCLCCSKLVWTPIAQSGYSWPDLALAWSHDP